MLSALSVARPSRALVVETCLSRSLIGLVLVAAVLAPLATLEAQQRVTDGPDLREEFQRRGMTYFDTYVEPSTAQYLSRRQLEAVTNTVRRQVDTLGRFDDIRPVGVPTDSLEAFVRALQEFLLEHEEDIARIRSEEMGHDYSFEFRDTIVTGEAMEQVLNSAYAYQVTLGEVSFHRSEGPYETQAPRIVARAPLDVHALTDFVPDLSGTKLSQQGEGLVFTSRQAMTDEEWQHLRALMADPEWTQALDTLYDRSHELAEEGSYERVAVTYQAPYVTAEIPVTVEFFKIEVLDEFNNIVPPEQAVVRVAQGTNTYRAAARQDGVIIERGSELYLDIVMLEGETVARERARNSVAEGESSAATKAGDAAPGELGGIETWIRRIPEFQVRAQIVEQWNNRVGMRPGASEDLYLDQWFRIYQEGEFGQRIDLGWTKIRHVGPGFRALGQGGTAADEERTELEVYRGDPEVGYMLGEYATYGIQLDVRFSYDLLSGHSGDDDELDANNGLFFANLFAGGSLARMTGVSELYFGIEAGVGFGDDLFGWYATLRGSKKIFLARGAWLLEVSVGFGLTQLVETREFEEDISSPTFLLFEPRARMIYWVSPHFEFYLDVSLRLGFGDTEEVTPEVAVGDDFTWDPIGLALGLGVSLSF